jgi:hypothetical protein
MKCTLIYDMEALGREEFEFPSHEAAWDWKEKNPPGPTVRFVFWYENGMMSRDARDLDSFSWDAYNKAVEDKRWREEYLKRTGKRWNEQGEPEKKTGQKQSKDSQPNIDSENQRLNESECLELLGLKPGFSQKELKTAWREAVRMNHPDKVAALSAEFKALAEKRTKKINQAYERLRTQKRTRNV